MRTSLLMGAVALLAISCTKNEPTICEPTESNYIKLAVGNYWVYDRYTIDADGVESGPNRRDSVVVVSDTLINGYMHAIKRTFINGSFSSDSYVRDYLDQLVDSDGIIHFSPFKLDEVLHFYENLEPVQYSLSSSMVEGEVEITTPVGVFQCLDKVTLIESDEPGTENSFPKTNHNYYANGIGLVKYNQHFFASSAMFSYRLVSYLVV